MNSKFWIVLLVAVVVFVFACEKETEPELPGQVAVFSTPPGATIMFNGKDRGMTPDTLSEVVAGEYSLRLTRDDYQDWWKTLEVTEGEMATVQAQLASIYGKLILLSAPSGAEVFVNGDSIGTVTPDTLKVMRGAYYSVLLRLDRYDDWESRRYMSRSDSVLVMNADLASLDGSINITSNPAGATIWLDGSSSGVTTPAVLVPVVPGTHTVELVMAGYRTWSTSVTVVKRKTSDVHATLALAYGSLEVISTPSGATIGIDGQNSGKVTPHTFSKVGIGDHNVWLTKAGHESWTGQVTVELDQTARVEGTLRELPTRLVVDSTPSGAQVWMNGASTGAVTLATFDDVSVGTYVVRVLLDGHFPFEEIVAVALGETRRVTATLHPAPRGVVAYQANDTLWANGLDGGSKVVLGTDASSSTISVRWSPDGRYIAYLTKSAGIAVMDENGNFVASLGPYGRGSDIAWSNDSRYVVVGAYTNGIFRLDVETGEVIEINNTWCFCYDHNPAYPPDDASVAFVHHEYGTKAWVFLIDPDGGNRRRVSDLFRTNHDEWLNMLWSDNETILFRTRRSGVAGLYELTPHLKGDSLTAPVRVIDGGITRFALSPDRTTIVYLVSSGNLYTAPVGVWTSTYVSNFSGATAIAWSPYGNAVVVRTKNGVFWNDLADNEFSVVDGAIGSGALDVKRE